MSHLSFDEQCSIQQGLSEGKVPLKIAKELGRSASTITREIKKNSEGHMPSLKGIGPSHCVHFKECHIRLIGYNSCKPESCETFEMTICPKLKRSPFVCNPCKKKGSCHSFKCIYKAKEAQMKYETQLKDARAGINATPEEIEKIDAILSPLITEHNLPLPHILSSHPEICLNIKTIYSYIDRGVFSAKNIDLQRKVRYKPRHTHHEVKVDRKFREGRTYEDFIKYSESHSLMNIVEMDTVEGKKGEPVILTLHFREGNFMIMHLLPQKTASCVCHALDDIERAIGVHTFSRMFAIILTDNGAEFSNPNKMERPLDKKVTKRTNIFYCDPRHSEQKGKIEKNHEYIRYILPKGTSFLHLNSTDVRYYNNNINNVLRPSLNFKSPYQIAEFVWGQETMIALNMEYIKPDDVFLVDY